MCQYANVPIGCAILPDGNHVLTRWNVDAFTYRY